MAVSSGGNWRADGLHLLETQQAADSDALWCERRLHSLVHPPILCIICTEGERTGLLVKMHKRRSAVRPRVQ